MRNLKNDSSQCPRCGNGQFREGTRGTLGYWAGRRIGPVECARCGYGMGYGVLESLPDFDAPAADAAGSKYYQEGHVEGRSGTFTGKAYSLHPRETSTEVEPTSFRVFGGDDDRRAGIKLPRLSQFRDWVILGLAAVGIVVVFGLIRGSI